MQGSVHLKYKSGLYEAGVSQSYGDGESTNEGPAFSILLSVDQSSSCQFHTSMVWMLFFSNMSCTFLYEANPRKFVSDVGSQLTSVNNYIAWTEAEAPKNGVEEGEQNWHEEQNGVGVCASRVPV